MEEAVFCAVWMVTYNHEKYIAQAIESVVTQKATFRFKLYIGDDCSKDLTSSICEGYAKKYPDKIEYLRNPKNIGAHSNGIQTYYRCFRTGAKYIALIEGDDYWSDELKLEKQINHLESDDSHILCFTRGEIDNDFNGVKATNADLVVNKVVSIQEMIFKNEYLTVTAVFRNDPLFEFPKWFHATPFGDWLLYLILLNKGESRAVCLVDITAVYRIQMEGLHGNVHSSNQKLIQAYRKHLSFYKFVTKHLFKSSYAVEIEAAVTDRLFLLTDLYLIEGQFLPAVQLTMSYLLKGVSQKKLISNLIRIARKRLKW